MTDDSKYWEKKLKAEGLGMGRGTNHDRLFYGGSDAVRAQEISWDDAQIWVKKSRKTRTPALPITQTCVSCGGLFVAHRNDAKTCSTICRQRKCRSVTHKLSDTNEGQA